MGGKAYEDFLSFGVNSLKSYLNVRTLQLQDIQRWD